MPALEGKGTNATQRKFGKGGVSATGKGKRSQEDGFSHSKAIKSMQLYNNLDRIWNELALINPEWCSGSGTRIPYEAVNKFDCYNYAGAAGATHVAQNVLGGDSSLDSRSVVLDIGSGLGGPARCVAALTGANVVGVDLQPDLVEKSTMLNERCGLDDKIKFYPQDFLDDSIELLHKGEEAKFDAALSWLCILHIPLADRSQLFKRASSVMKKGSIFYIEDFFLLEGRSFTEEERELLAEEIYVPNGELPTRKEYCDVVEANGFKIVNFDDVTEEWTQFVDSRCAAWLAAKERHSEVHNEATWASLYRFYSAMQTLYSGPNLGGVKLTLQKI